MNKLILKATEVNATTIIPNFGAIMKMGKTFMYNEFLKYDDGKLAKFIAGEKGIEESVAKEEIANWVTTIQADLDGGKTVVLDGVGELVNVDGKMKFTAKATSASETSVPPVMPEKKEEPKPEPVKEVAPPKVEKEEKEVPKPVETKLEEVKEEPKKEKKIKTSADYKAKEAVEKVSKFKDKNDLIAFTRGETRKTVVAALNTKLDEFNGKKKDKKEEVTSNEVKPPKNVVTEVKTESKAEKVETPPVVKEEPKPAVKEEKKEIVPPVEEKKEEKPIAVVPPAPAKEETPVKPVEPLKQEKKEVVVPKEDEKSIKEKAAAIEKPETNKEEEDAAIAAIVSGVEQSEKETGKRKKRWILWVGLILILLGGGTAGYLKKDVIMGWFDKKHEPKDLAEGHDDQTEEETTHDTDNHEEETATTVEEHTDTVEEEHSEMTTDTEETAETVVEESVVEEPEPVKEEPVKETPTPAVNTSSEGSWHIIAGSYSSQANAENKVATLKSEGYSSAKVLGKYNGLYTVRVASYPSKEEAKSALSSYTSSGNKGFIKNL
jgi:hypothetical protein